MLHIRDPHNARLKVFDPSEADLREGGPLARLISQFLRQTALSKLTVYARPGMAEHLAEAGFLEEGWIVGYFGGEETAHVMTRYQCPKRAVDCQHETTEGVVALAKAKARPVGAAAPPPPQQGHARSATTPDVAGIVDLLVASFDTYPTELSNEHIGALIADGSSLFELYLDGAGRIVGAASAECDPVQPIAEISDCVVDPQWQGHGITTYLIHRLHERLLQHTSIRHTYSLARALEAGMNISLAKMGYTYTGRLTNNCQMPTGWESMNVWCRAL